MCITKIAHNIKNAITTNGNIGRIERKFGECFYTDSEKLGDGAFVVKGFRPASDATKGRSYSPTSLSGFYDFVKREHTPTIVTMFDPKTGLKTSVRAGIEQSAPFVDIFQKFGEEPKIDTSILENIAPEKIGPIEKIINEIKANVGKIIPTLKDIKQ